MKINRLIFNGWPTTDKSKLKNKIKEVLDNYQSDILLLPGGSLIYNINKDWEDSGWNTHKDFDIVFWSILKKKVADFCKSFNGKYLSIGVDLRSEKTNKHAELVCFIDLESNELLRVTGKSYPTGDQEQSLVHITNLQSHCLELDGERILLLGCHDLNIYNARAITNLKEGSERWKRWKEFRRVADEFKPTLILHHPHATDTSKTWKLGWSGLKKAYGNIQYASGISYTTAKPIKRESLVKVLLNTASNLSGTGIIVSGREFPTKIQKNFIPNT